jgi:hypothetical protein
MPVTDGGRLFLFIKIYNLQPKEAIQQQIESNNHLNLLYRGQKLLFVFSDAIKDLIGKVVNNELGENEISELIEFACQTSLLSFYNINQYFQFDQQAELELKTVYRQLVNEVKKSRSADLNDLSRKHFSNLQKWFIKKQPDAFFLFPSEMPKINSKVICAEYSAHLQLKILGINISSLQEPILDIGCGREHQLVNYLRQKGLNAFGIDRNAESKENIQGISWFDFNFEKDHWGTIISHLGFTNHFLHQHSKQYGSHQRFAYTFIEILQSLKTGGRFYYAPGLPFIETFLNPDEYAISQRAPGTIYQCAAVQRLR